MMSKATSDTMHQLRMNRNIAMHDSENLSIKSADDLLKRNIELSVWFYS